MEEELLQVVQGIVGKVKPEWLDKHERHCSGEGFVGESIFFVGDHRIVWIVYLPDLGTFAFKEVSAEGLEIFAQLILQSPTIFVEYNKYHRIVEWLTFQPKEAPAV